MTEPDDKEDERYRAFIDELVTKCQDDFYENKVMSGIWNQNAKPDFVPEDHDVNQLLAALTTQQRQVLGRLLTTVHSDGVFDVLVSLHEAEVKPFDRGYEGDPFHDFVGRLHDWEWPDDERWS